MTIGPEMDKWLETQNKPYQQLDQLAYAIKATMKPSLYARLVCWIKRKIL